MRLGGKLREGAALKLCRTSIPADESEYLCEHRGRSQIYELPMGYLGYDLDNPVSREMFLVVSAFIGVLPVPGIGINSDAIYTDPDGTSHSSYLP